MNLSRAKKATSEAPVEDDMSTWVVGNSNEDEPYDWKVGTSNEIYKKK
jgi:hypothetical protein